jgi:hypothetical protein
MPMGASRIARCPLNHADQMPKKSLFFDRAEGIIGEDPEAVRRA